LLGEDQAGLFGLGFQLLAQGNERNQAMRALCCNRVVRSENSALRDGMEFRIGKSLVRY
jgi:hypothetical protein